MAAGVLDLEHTVTDVVEGKEYLFSVAACNKCGPGEPAYIDEPVNVSSPASEFFFTDIKLLYKINPIIDHKRAKAPFSI